MADKTITPTAKSRQEAKRLGLDRYFTGKICVNGHVSERYSYGGCIACASDFYKNNSDEIKRRAARWGKDNPEKVRAIQRQQRKNNPETFKVIHRRYRERHPEEVKAREKNWRSRNIEKMTRYDSAYQKRRYHENIEHARIKARVDQQRRRTLKRNAKGSFTREDIARMLRGTEWYLHRLPEGYQ